MKGLYENKASAFRNIRVSGLRFCCRAASETLTYRVVSLQKECCFLQRCSTVFLVFFLSSSFSLLLSFILPSSSGIFLVLSGIQGHLLVFIQLVLCENCCLYICICVYVYIYIYTYTYIHIFLIHLWRQMTSRSSYYPAILLYLMLLFHSGLAILLSLVTISVFFSCKPWDL